MDDWTLLQRYVRGGSRDDLDLLVRKYLPMVYAAALRQMREPHRAEDVTQVVFLVLMRRASRISRNVVLAGWLHKVTAFTAAKMRRSESRRQSHETRAAAMNVAAVEPAGAPVEQTKMEGLDEAIAAMPRKYRDVVVLRYLQGKSIGEVAALQAITENAARQRLFRALGRLRKRLGQKGAPASQEALGALLTAAGGRDVPAEVTARVVAALHSTAVGGAASATAAIILRLMFMAKVKTTIVAASVALLLCALVGGGTIYYFSSGSETVRMTPPRPEVIPAAPMQPGTKGLPNEVLLDAFDAFHGANVDKLVGVFEPLGAEREAQFRKTAAALSAVMKLRTALSKRFGAGAADQVLQSANIDPPRAISGAIRVTPPVIDGQTARMSLMHLGEVDFVQVGGTWKLRADMLTNFEKVFDQLQTGMPAIEKLAANVEAGEYTTVAGARADLQRMLQDIRQPDPMPPPERPAELRPGATPRETLAAFFWAMVSGDEDAAIGCLQNPEPGEQGAMRIMTDMFAAGEQIRVGLADRFGNAAARNTILMLGLDTGLSRTILDSAPTTFTGNKADVDLKKTYGIILHLSKTNGVWKIEPIWHDEARTRAWPELLRDKYLPRWRQLAADIKAGKFRTMQQLQPAIQRLRGEIQADHKRYVAATQQAK